MRSTRSPKWGCVASPLTPSPSLKVDRFGKALSKQPRRSSTQASQSRWSPPFGRRSGSIEFGGIKVVAWPIFASWLRPPCRANQLQKTGHPRRAFRPGISQSNSTMVLDNVLGAEAGTPRSVSRAKPHPEVNKLVVRPVYLLWLWPPPAGMSGHRIPKVGGRAGRPNYHVLCPPTVGRSRTPLIDPPRFNRIQLVRASHNGGPILVRLKHVPKGRLGDLTQSCHFDLLQTYIHRE